MVAMLLGPHAQPDHPGSALESQCGFRFLEGRQCVKRSKAEHQVEGKHDVRLTPILFFA